MEQNLDIEQEVTGQNGKTKKFRYVKGAKQHLYDASQLLLETKAFFLGNTCSLMI